MILRQESLMKYLFLIAFLLLLIAGACSSGSTAGYIPTPYDPDPETLIALRHCAPGGVWAFVDTAWVCSYPDLIPPSFK